MHGYAFAGCIVYRVFCAAAFTIENSDYSVGVIHHPLVSDLKAGAAVMRANKQSVVSSLHYGPVPTLPIFAPASFKAVERTGTHKPNGHTGLS